MNSAPTSVPDPSMPAHLRPEVVQAIEEAHEFARAGNNDAGIKRLEQALANISKQSDLDEFKERVSLAMALAEFSVNAGNPQEAIQRLATEFAVAKETFQRTKATGADDEKRMAFRGLVQLKDLHTRLKLIGEPAPEIQIHKWLNTEALTLAELKSQVVLLEFWATWCKPCEQLFPKIKELHARHSSQDLNVLALTRYFMAYGGPAEAKEQEITLIREFTNNHEIRFPVGVAEDESVQSAYGATALPMLALVDRTGIVRSFAFSPDDENFQRALVDCLG
ncbi:MAG TPA: redoxin domain-containing protein [Pyrinomonadaceae bacterium]|nr:redoxin domain-containing protein [Pyrinomonadaceae bacterium]